MCPCEACGKPLYPDKPPRPDQAIFCDEACLRTKLPPKRVKALERYAAKLARERAK